MARPARTTHPLRQFRKVAGLTQENVAGALGIKPHSVTRIENGDKLRLTQDHAYTLAAKYGVLPSSVMAGSRGPMDLMGRPYTAASREQWESIQQHPAINIALMQRLGGYGGTLLTGFLHAASQRKEFMEAKFGFDNWLLAAIQRFGLGKTFNASLRAVTTETFVKKVTAEEIHADADFAKELKFPDRSKLAGHIPIEIEAERFLTYRPEPMATSAPDNFGSDALHSVLLTEIQWRTLFKVTALNRTYTGVRTDFDNLQFVSMPDALPLPPEQSASATHSPILPAESAVERKPLSTRTERKKRVNG